jgi:peptide/nickel transport system substrate-binding protein
MENVTLEVAPIYYLAYVYVNHSVAPLDSREFRLALNYATDRDAILRNVYFGYGEIPNSFMPKMNFWSADVPVIPYDIEKAKELVAQSGYNGETIDILISSGDSMGKQAATMMQQSWAEAGINSQISEMDGGAIWDMVVNGTYMVNVSGISSDINDDDELATLQADTRAPGDFHGFFSYYESEEVSDLLAQARQATDPVVRAGIYKQVQEIVYYQDGYNIPLNFLPYVNSYYNRVHGWQTLTVGWWWLKDVWMDQ